MMTEQEYIDYVDELLRSFGGSWALPSGDSRNNLYFSVAKHPIEIPHPKILSPEQRLVVVSRLGEKYGFPYIPKK
jgi:hypothetical protein